MKKLLYLLLLLPLGLLASCDDHDDMPDVTVTVSMSNVSQYDGITYVVQGDTINVNGITVQPVTGGNAALTAVEYFLDNVYIGYSPVAPFSAKILTAELRPGDHLLQMQTAILQVDKSIANAYLSYPLRVVESADDLPDNAPERGTYSASVTASTSK